MGDEILFSQLNSYAAMMYEKMDAMGREKWAGYKIHLLKKWFSVTRLKCTAYIGSFTLSSPDTKQRWFLGADALPFAGTWVSPADLARLYLTIKYKDKKRRINTAQWENFYKTHRQMPLWADPLYMDHAYYVDIQSAYWSIMRAVGWDVQYTPGRVLGLKDPIGVNDFPFAHIKMARNCLVSISADGSKRMRFWDGTNIVSRKGSNGLVNRMLYCLVCDILNGVAFDAVNAGAVYAFTDGFIVPAHRLQAVQEAIAAWGLPVSYKREGECEITGPGAYRFGSFATRKYNIQRPHRFHKINPVAVDFLRDRFRRAAEYNRINQPFEEWRHVKRLSTRLDNVKDT